MSKCEYCDGTKVIRFESPHYSDLGNIHSTCPCVKLDMEKFKAQQYKQLAETINNTLTSTCFTVGKLMPSAISIANKSSKFLKSQVKLIGNL